MTFSMYGCATRLLTTMMCLVGVGTSVGMAQSSIDPAKQDALKRFASALECVDPIDDNRFQAIGEQTDFYSRIYRYVGDEIKFGLEETKLNYDVDAETGEPKNIETYVETYVAWYNRLKPAMVLDIHNVDSGLLLDCNKCDSESCPRCVERTTGGARRTMTCQTTPCDSDSVSVTDPQICGAKKPYQCETNRSGSGFDTTFQVAIYLCDKVTGDAAQALRDIIRLNAE